MLDDNHIDEGTNKMLHQKFMNYKTNIESDVNITNLFYAA
jgi:hypothetical protein